MSRAAEEELLNVYDAEGRVTGALPRREAKRSGLAVGAVNALVLNGRGELLMQRRPAGKENGGLWDKSVGGHVSAGESFDATLLREAGEELFDDPRSQQVRLVAGDDLEAAAGFDLRHGVLLRSIERRLNLRDVRHAPGGGVRRVLYHLAIYAGRTELPLDGFRPQKSEIDELRYVPIEQVDAMLLQGRLAPNMAFLWLTQAQALLQR
ncbi:MAG TPA: NUDIX domain-containing protein [Methylomirabilota bacterium]|nr:NUDIX domain-containing protein [Methylomirabilota bacterium]